jgi:RND family efflux transporter MFP subunit
MTPRPVAWSCALLVLAAGCERHQEQAVPPIRPVLSVVVQAHSSRSLGFAGTVEPRYRASLGFRVLGRIIARDVNVGDTVTKDQRLAAIDPVALELAVRAAEADLANALAQLANATATETRQQILLTQNTTTTAQFELAQQAREAAAASVARARASLSKAREQLGYAELRAEFDGVVTGIEAEVGQVVSAGQTVVTIARPDIREAVVDIPEDVDDSLQPGTRFDVALQIDPAIRAAGRVREIAPQADPATRTRRVRITLDDPPANLRLGTTVTATLTTPAKTEIELPASALSESDGKPMVWVVDPSSRTVSSREVRVARRDGGRVQIADGLAPGTRVVTAGVRSLTPGQQVKIPEEASR